jgi:hypothetical protein
VVRLLVAALLLAVLIPGAAAPPAARAADPTFAAPVELPGGNTTSTSVAVGDLNGDGKADIVLGSFYELNTLQPRAAQIFLNPGNGDFGSVTPQDLPGSDKFTGAVALGDLNGDGKLDIVLGNLYDQASGAIQDSQVYLNPGNGNFAAVTPATLAGSGGANSVALGDLNGDGKLDIVLGRFFDPQAQQPLPSLVYLNPGSGQFGAVTPAPLLASTIFALSVALADFDGDGRLDVVLGSPAANLPSLVYRNPGTGNFGSVVPTPLRSSGGANSVAAGDVNGDGKPDIVLGKGNSQSQLYLNPGSGDFTAVTPAPIVGSGGPTIAIKLGDMNGDGLTDLVVANNVQSAQVFLNNGRGGFAAPFDIAISFNGAQGLALGDLNGDNMLDIVLANLGRPSQVFLNTRTSAFVAPSFAFPAPLPGTGRSTYGVAVGDLNGDGALDVVLGNNGAASQVFVNKNDGSGGFAAPIDLSTPGGTRKTFSVALGDLNGDGALDIVLGNSGSTVNGQFVPQPSQVYFNDGKGGFGAPIDLPGSGRPTRSVALGDLNGDGLLDIVLANNVDPDNTAIDYFSQVYLNPGGGNFAAATPQDLPDSGRVTLSVVVADFNGDNKPDIVLGNYFVQQGLQLISFRTQIYLNPGDGNFGNATAQDLPGSGKFTSAVSTGDLNGDGAFDLVLANYGQPSQVFLNKNDGSGTFQPPIDLPESGSFAQVVAVGDLNNDGKLDLVLTNTFGQPSQVYINQGGGRFAAPATLPGSGNETIRMALADLNGDGLLDIILGNNGQPSQVYMNTGAISFSTPAPLPGSGNNTFGVAAADLNGDGALDLALANRGQSSQIYLNKNDGSGAFLAPADLPGSTAALSTTNVVAGDVNGDGALDLVLANFNAASQVYLNKDDGSGTFLPPINLAGSGTRTQTAAVADLDGDGRLDIVLGRPGQPSLIYLNSGGDWSTVQPRQLPGSGRTTLSLALVDVSGDGMTDIVLGNNGEVSQVYLNDGLGGFVAPADLPSGAVKTQAIAAADLNGDGAADLVLGNFGQSSQVLLNNNDGTGTFEPPADIAGTGNFANRIALGDLNGDGAADLVIGNFFNQRSKVYLNKNDGSGTFGSPADILGSGDSTLGVALGDLNGDGALDIVLGNGQGIRGANGPFSQVYLNRSARAARLPENPPTVSIRRPGPADDGAFLSTPVILDSQVISLTYRLADPEGDPVAAVRASFSLDGGGSWHPAVPVSGTVTTDLPTAGNTPNCSAAGCTYSFAWDTFASKLFGQSDEVVVRIQAFPSARPRPGDVAGTYQRPFASATTFPFRVRGLQVRVLGPGGAPAVGAQVYRLPAGRSSGALPIPNLGGGAFTPPFLTNAQGFLRGRGEIGAGDQLIALLPVSFNTVYSSTVSMYQTNIITSAIGLSGDMVTGPGVQTLSVGPAHPLALLNLDVSLEWDARADTRFMAQLQHDLLRTSEILFNWTRGQVALGQIHVFHNRLMWDFANVRIYASNRVRPNSVIGGAATQPLTDTTGVGTALYGPGQIHMGAVWNRFGNSNYNNLSEDWPRTLAHELAHYALFQQDNYVGLNGAGQIIPVTDCASVMSDYYGSVNGFQTRASWSPSCDQTLSNRTTGRADWETITKFYPALIAPTGPLDSRANPGPTGLPLGVTQIRTYSVITPTAALDVPIFYTSTSAGSYQPGLGARGYLFQSNPAKPAPGLNEVVALGRANLNQILARGALPGDRLCLFEPSAHLQGCKTIVPGDDQLPLINTPNWPPDIVVTPVTTNTLALTVTGALADGLALKAQLFLADNLPAPSVLSLASQGGGVYAGTFVLPFPSAEAYLHLWIDGPGQQPEFVTTIGVSGNPGYVPVDGQVLTGRGQVLTGGGQVLTGGGQVLTGGGIQRSGGGIQRSGGGQVLTGGGQVLTGGGQVLTGGGQVLTGGGIQRSGGGIQRSGGGQVLTGGGQVLTGGAPGSTAEGDVLMIGDNLTFDVGQFVALQATTSLPSPPTWATVIGNAYRFTVSPNPPNLAGAALSFNYLRSEVPAGEESGIKVYYRAPGAAGWAALPTTLNIGASSASVQWQGPGLYALMSSVDVPLSGPGWNLVAYPVRAAKPIAEALASIDGKYDLVYTYITTDTAQPWRIYSPGAPDFVNTLSRMEFGRGYWVHITSAGPLTLSLNGGTGVGTLAATVGAAPAPPATYYGAVEPSSGLAPAPGQIVTAQVGASACGQATTQLFGGQVVYVLHVSADDGAGAAGCGVVGRSVKFQVGGVPMLPLVPWDSGRLHTQPLSAMPQQLGQRRIYLPIAKH